MYGSNTAAAGDIGSWAQLACRVGTEEEDEPLSMVRVMEEEEEPLW
jgi:hypothetical protein